MRFKIALIASLASFSAIAGNGSTQQDSSNMGWGSSDYELMTNVAVGTGRPNNFYPIEEDVHNMPYQEPEEVHHLPYVECQNGQVYVNGACRSVSTAPGGTIGGGPVVVNPSPTPSNEPVDCPQYYYWDWQLQQCTMYMRNGSVPMP